MPLEPCPWAIFTAPVDEELNGIAISKKTHNTVTRTVILMALPPFDKTELDA
jgi:hypothetical protein